MKIRYVGNNSCFLLDFRFIVHLCITFCPMCSAQLVVLLCCDAQEGRPHRRADRTVTSEPCAAVGGPRPLTRPLLEHGRAHHTVGWLSGLSCAQIARLRFQNESKQLNLTNKVTFQCKLIAIFHGKI